MGRGGGGHVAVGVGVGDGREEREAGGRGERARELHQVRERRWREAATRNTHTRRTGTGGRHESAARS